ncbi:MAG: hypothetical protein C0602_12810 [Denitrovibrio sp.]|nr:MAG: hypothetical protein C0602_12810 [Denitrovibrio sp.]
MQTVQQIKQSLIQNLENCGVFDSVLTPSDDRRQSTIMREPSAAVFFSGLKSTEDNGVVVCTAVFEVDMKFLKVGVNETSDDIETVMKSLSELEPCSLSQKMTKGANDRSAVYRIEAAFNGCRQ